MILGEELVRNTTGLVEAHRIWDASRRRDKYEAIIENIVRKGGCIPEDLEEKLRWAEIDLAVAKDDRSDPLFRDE